MRSLRHRRGLAFLSLTSLSLVALATPGSAKTIYSPGVKSQMAGTIDRNQQPPSAYGPAVVNWVVQVDWAALQPTSGGGLETGSIDTAITAARAARAVVKLRVLGGMRAPSWVQSIGGPPMNICNDQGISLVCGAVGRYWTANYRTAFENLESQLAAKYDTDPTVVAVNGGTRCMTTYAEPMIREVGYTPNLAAFVDAGYTIPQDKTCQTEDMTWMGRVWKHTRTELAFNPYQEILSSSSSTIDEGFTESQMDLCRRKLADRCVLGNNSLSSPESGGSYTAMYDKIQSLGPPIYFQTATAAKVGDLASTLQDAINRGAGMVELPSGYSSLMSEQALAPYSSQLAAQAVVAP